MEKILRKVAEIKYPNLHKNGNDIYHKNDMRDAEQDAFTEGGMYQWNVLRYNLDKLKEFLYSEIIERRDYSASKSFELVLEEINTIFKDCIINQESLEDNNYEVYHRNEQELENIFETALASDGGEYWICGENIIQSLVEKGYMLTKIIKGVTEGADEGAKQV